MSDTELLESSSGRDVAASAAAEAGAKVGLLPSVVALLIARLGPVVARRLLDLLLAEPPRLAAAPGSPATAAGLLDADFSVARRLIAGLLRDYRELILARLGEMEANAIDAIIAALEV